MVDLKVLALKNINFKRGCKLKYNLDLILKSKSLAHLIYVEKFKTGSILIQEGKPVHGIYFLLHGQGKIYSTGSKGKTQTLRLVSGGDLIGISSLNAKRYWSSVLASTDIEAYFISQKNLNLIIKSNSGLNLLFLDALSKRIRHYEIRQKHLSLFPTLERVIDALILTASKFGFKTEEGIALSSSISRKELASFAGTTIESNSRALSILRSKNLIAINGKVIILKDKNELINRLKFYCCKENSLGKESQCYPSLNF